MYHSGFRYLDLTVSQRTELLGVLQGLQAARVERPTAAAADGNHKRSAQSELVRIAHGVVWRRKGVGA